MVSCTIISLLLHHNNYKNKVHRKHTVLESSQNKMSSPGPVPGDKKSGAGGLTAISLVFSAHQDWHPRKQQPDPTTARALCDAPPKVVSARPTWLWLSGVLGCRASVLLDLRSHTAQEGPFALSVGTILTSVRRKPCTLWVYNRKGSTQG